MADPKKFDPQNPYGKVTKNAPAVVEKLNPKEGKLYEAMETSPDKLRKSKTYKLALWCPTMQEARRQAKEMNARTPFGRPKVSQDPNNPQSGADYPLPKAEGPGAEVKQFVKQPKQDPKDALPKSPNKMPWKVKASKLLASLYDATQGLTWEIGPKSLELSLDEAGQAALREAIEENGGNVSNQMEMELLENLFSNSELDPVSPEEVGALTSSTLIGDVERDDQGNITQVHNIYYDRNYAVRSFAQDLADKGEATLYSGVEPATSSTDKQHFKVGDKVKSKIGELGTVVEEEIGSKVGVQFEDDPQIQLVRVKDLTLQAGLKFKAEPVAVTLSFKKFDNTQGQKDDAIELTIKPADERVLSLVTPGLDSMAGRFKDLGNGVYEVMAQTVDEAKGYAKDGLAGSGLNVSDETDSVLVLDVPAPVVAALKLHAAKVGSFAVGDMVVDRHGQTLEVAEIGNDKKRGPWLDLESTEGDRNRYYDKPQGPTEAVKLDEDVNTLVKEDDYDPSQSYPGDYPAGRSAEEAEDEEAAGPEGLKSFDFIATWKGVKAPSEDVLRSIFSVDGEHAGAFWVGGEESDQEEHQNIGYREFDVQIKKAGKGKFNVDVIFHDIRATDMAEAEALSEDWGLHVNVDYLEENGLSDQVQFPTADGDTALANSSKLVEAKPVKARLGLRGLDVKGQRVLAKGKAPILRDLRRAFGPLTIANFSRSGDIELAAGAQYLGVWKDGAFNYMAAADDVASKLTMLFLGKMQIKANQAVNQVVQALEQADATDIEHREETAAESFSATLPNGVKVELSLDFDALQIMGPVEFFDPEDMMGPPFEATALSDADLAVQVEELIDLLKEVGARQPEPVEAELKRLVASLKIEGELLKVGDKVQVATGYGRGPVKDGVIASITLADERGGADGAEVKQMSWDLVPDWASVTFEDASLGWAYGYQLRPAGTEQTTEVQAASKNVDFESLPEELRNDIDQLLPDDHGVNTYDGHRYVLVFQGYDQGSWETIASGSASIEKVEAENLKEFKNKVPAGMTLVYQGWTDDPYGEAEENVYYAVYQAKAKVRAAAPKLTVGQKVETMEGPGEIVDAGALQQFAKDADVSDQAQELAHHEPEVNIQGLDAEAMVYKVKLEDGSFVLDDGTNLQAGRKPRRSFTAAKPKKEKAPAAEPAAEDFKEKARKALAKHLDIPIEDMPEADDKGNHHFVDDALQSAGRAASWSELTQEAGGRDYVVYDSYETAEEAAIDYVLNNLQEQPEIFNQDWLMGEIPHRDLVDHFEEVVRESIEFYVDDMDEDELKTQIEDAGVEDRDELIEKLIREAGDPVDYVRDNFGEEEVGTQLKEVWRGLGTGALREIARSAVDADGPGHFLSGWDGELTELDGGLQLSKW